MAQLSEDQIRLIAEEAIKKLGKTASPEAVEKIVKETVQRVTPAPAAQTSKTSAGPQSSAKSQNRIIVTAFGRNRIGILAGLTGVLADHGCDILDLSQKILQDFFTIMLLVNISDCAFDFEGVKKQVIARGEELDLKVIVQHEDIFNAMHRI